MISLHDCIVHVYTCNWVWIGVHVVHCLCFFRALWFTHDQLVPRDTSQEIYGFFYVSEMFIWDIWLDFIIWYVASASFQKWHLPFLCEVSVLRPVIFIAVRNAGSSWCAKALYWQWLRYRLHRKMVLCLFCSSFLWGCLWLL